MEVRILHLPDHLKSNFMFKMMNKREKSQLMLANDLAKGIRANLNVSITPEIETLIMDECMKAANAWITDSDRRIVFGDRSGGEPAGLKIVIPKSK